MPFAFPALLPLLLLTAPGVSAPAANAPSWVVLPERFVLSGREATQGLLVEQVRDGHMVGPAETDVNWESSDLNVVRVVEQRAVPVGNGTATLTARIGEHSAQCQVEVVGMEQPFTWSFRNHVQSILTKQGCNSGACHGAAAGKKGFRLSLRGYDAHGDYDILTRQALGRRVRRSEPGRSLLLLKPTATIDHGGGERFSTDSFEYRVLGEWIANGADGPTDADPIIERLEVFPAATTLSPSASQPLLVRAFFSDGHAEDVTRWAKYTATNAEVATVDDNGLVTVAGHGEGGVTVWYLNQLAVATVTVPYVQPVAAAVFANAPRHNFIDELVLEKLVELNLPPSPPCNDAEFIRRVSLDLTGTLPRPEQLRAFLEDPSPNKRSALIDQLLDSEEFVDYWAYKLSDLLLVNSERLPPAAMWSYYQWIRDRVASNTPWDELTRELLTAQGSTLENGASVFFLLHQSPQLLTETISQTFLGMSINCARCHNHPLEKWTNDQYYGLANMVARVRVKDLAGEGNVMVYSDTRGDLAQPLRGVAQPPQPLDGKPLPLESPDDRRIALAQWVTDPSNPYFSRAIVNRIWANFFSVGLVEAVDDLRLTNPASNEKLHRRLADDFVAQRYDLRELMRRITQSATYQRSSTPLEENAGDRRFYSRYYPRRLMAEVLHDALAQATGVPTDFPGYPKGWRALRLPDSNVESYFLKSFGRPDRVITCECERTSEPNMVQVLHLSNGNAVNDKLRREGNRVDQLLSSGLSEPAIIEEIYLSTLCRPPTPRETQPLSEALTQGPAEERRQRLEDIFWSVLCSKEFLFNH